MREIHGNDYKKHSSQSTQVCNARSQSSSTEKMPDKQMHFQPTSVHQTDDTEKSKLLDSCDGVSAVWHMLCNRYNLSHVFMSGAVSLVFKRVNGRQKWQKLLLKSYLQIFLEWFKTCTRNKKRLLLKKSIVKHRV